jgi:hypothetical protein
MMQAMVLLGILTICAVSGVLLTHRPRWTPGPDEPTGSYTAPKPPVPSAPAATPATGLPPIAVAAPKPSQPLPVKVATAAPAPARPPAVPVRRSRNNGFNRFTPAPVRARAGRA